MAYRLLAGPDPRDPSSSRLPPASATRRPRIGWFARLAGEPVHLEVEAAVQECVAVLQAAGYDIVPRAAPYDVAIVCKVWGTLSSAGAARAAEMHPDRWRSEASAAIAATAARGLALTAVDYVRALDSLAEIRTGVADA
ncbi:amidase family protein [Plastoroseomonas arctica]|uniref:Amidase n=1 Tax=Plastoroseomonas arctica TaxID=1509237 RepID=A0AAF1JX30_9PROT|nr:amidase family protein [Plastoroseomonas arctica]MBR0655786.1 hypothetical protein [Plastoroseomonas arctica]